VPFDARAFQRDRHAIQRVTFPAMTAAEVKIFSDWYQDDLYNGGCWFAATWPLPEGIVAAVRRFMQPPRFEYLYSGFWRISAVFEVRGRGMLPVRGPVMLLGLHFDEDFTDETGHPIAPWHWLSIDEPPTIETTTPQFGGYMFGAADSLLQPLLSDVRGALNLNEFGEWQTRFWVRLDQANIYTGKAGGMVWTLQGASQSGGSIPGTPGGDAFQISVRVDRIGGEAAGFASLRVTYNARDPVITSVNASASLHPVAVDSELVPIDDAWHFIAVCGDSTSTRAYIDTNLALDDANSPHPAGTSPLWADEDASFENQVFIVAAAFNGGISDDGWPSTAIFGQYFCGGLDDLQITQGPGCVEFTGATITVPDAPFENP
jgi:hypothetical protein